MMKQLIPWIIITVTIIGCHTQRKITTTPPKERKANEVYNKIKSFHYDWLDLRAKVHVKDKKNGNRTFTANIRAKKDSVIWFMASMVGIPGVRFLIDADSIRIIDLQNKKYTQKNYSYIKKILYLPEVDFSVLEELLSGNILYYNEQADSIRTLDNQYVLESKEENLHTQIWVHPDSFTINRILLKDLFYEQALEITYKDYSIFEGQKFPVNREIKIIREDTVFVEMNFNKVKLEGPLKMPFKVPEGYERIN